ncbi:ParB/RepB/Spo0J family partition protein [Amycolatopsis sp. NPDC004079]|uniref:IbrB-like domain-containing protein n=1 Tax=Amycolatopsis sp. NPDC004079 TaxID=3154549 RepID=UPI0033B7F5A8
MSTDPAQTALDLDTIAAGAAAPARPPTVSAAGQDLLDAAETLFARLDQLDVQDRIDTVNALRLALHRRSPLREQPVDCVLWLPADQVGGNDYNPNAVAPPEMELLTHSIATDGYTQPIVAWPAGDRQEVVDGFHRHRIGKENAGVRTRVHGRLPVTLINTARTGRDDRMASTIRHNRARGEHQVGRMADIVVEMSRNGKTDQWIARELGMEPDEVLRLRQTTGLAELFADEEFSEAWEHRPGNDL